VNYVADASTVLAYVKGEDARPDLIHCLDASGISVVNLIEVAEFYTQIGQDRAAAERVIASLGMSILPIDQSLAIDAALMRPLTRKAGLSLADRVCLATANRANLPALTGDRKWAEVAESVGSKVELIR
jgi:ribonuclease VapC